MSASDSRRVRMETNPRVWIAALRHSQDQLASIVQPLSSEQLRGSSYHSWTIAQVLGHMGSQAEIFMGWATNALEGTEPAGQEAMQAIWDAWDARRREEQAADSLRYNERLVRRFEEFSDDELTRMHLNLFGMELDATGLPRLRLAEHAVHTWDIAVALDPAAQIAPDAGALLIDTLDFLASRVGKSLDRAFRLHVLTSEPARDFSLRVEYAVELTSWEDGPADGELRIPAEAFVRLVYGRLDPAHTPETTLTGRVTLDDVRSVFPGV